jgi:tRNA-specific 2-thiouridylase
LYLQSVANQTTKKTRVVVAMSGGVDSSVTAALLLEQGYDVIGVTMKTYEFDEVGGNIENEASCCGLGAMHDARMVAAKLGIPHYVVDFRRRFERDVINYFVDEYIRGRTPNPCIMCNREVKWGELLDKATALGAQFIATGHYARLNFDESLRRYVLSRARYLPKDQSYALWALSQEALSRTMLPLGSMSKPEVRRLAEKYGLRTAQKQESFEICFVPDNSYERFLKERIPELEHQTAGGDIVWEGKVVGKHQGYPFYTVGQRRGLGSFGEPVYVTAVESTTNTVHIGRQEDLLHRSLLARSVNLVSVSQLPSTMRIEAKVRYRDDATSASLSEVEEDVIQLDFDEPKRAITPGQSVVFYRGDVLVGGAIIDRVLA